MSVQSTVDGIKASLSKMLPAESLSDEDMEGCKDMFQQLDDAKITLDILTRTLIGTVVSKFKVNSEVGPTAKALLKKWKKIAKEGAASSTTTTHAKAERRESISQAVADAEVEWSGLQPHRQTTVKKIHSFLLAFKKTLVKQGINAGAVEHLAVERASEIETTLGTKFPDSKRSDYLAKARSLCFNIKKNAALSTQILLGQISGEELVNMSNEELASDEKKKEMEERARKLVDSNRLDWEQANEEKINEMCGIKGDLALASLFTCGRCKSIKTTSTQKQTRSADEPMTVFVLCLNCGKRWKC